MGIAQQVSKRSTCDRKNVGAVIVRDKSYCQQDIMEVYEE